LSPSCHVDAAWCRQVGQEPACWSLARPAWPWKPPGSPCKKDLCSGPNTFLDGAPKKQERKKERKNKGDVECQGLLTKGRESPRARRAATVGEPRTRREGRQRAVCLTLGSRQRKTIKLCRGLSGGPERSPAARMNKYPP